MNITALMIIFLAVKDLCSVQWPKPRKGHNVETVNGIITAHLQA